MDWDKLRIFHAVAEAGSFTHAGDTLNLSQSSVSRQIGALEDSLSVSLFHRHARGLILTEQGDVLYRTVRDVFAKLSMVEARLAEGREKPSGPLKITATVAFGSYWLSPRMREFVELYPDIRVELVLTDIELDLGMREADVAIRMGAPRSPDLIQRHLFTVHSYVYAAPAYIERMGMPDSIGSLEDHKIVAFGDGQNAPVPAVNWLTRVGMPGGGRRVPALSVNNVFAIRQAIESGLGMGALPIYMAHGADGLVRVLPDEQGPEVEAYFVYPEELRNSKRIGVFRDFLLRKLAESHF